MVLGAILAHTAFNVLNDLVEKTGQKSYANVCSFYFGKTNAKIVMNFLIFAQFCSCLLYPCISESLILY